MEGEEVSTDRNRMSAGAAALVAGVVGLLLGASVGIELAPVPDEPLLHCSIQPSLEYPLCPPVDDRVVFATWSGGLRTTARWNGRYWELTEPAAGHRSTREHPITWRDL